MGLLGLGSHPVPAVSMRHCLQDSAHRPSYIIHNRLPVRAYDRYVVAFDGVEGCEARVGESSEVAQSFRKATDRIRHHFLSDRLRLARRIQ